MNKEDLRQRLEELILEGKQNEATSKRVETSIKPDYYDEKRFHKAQKTCQKYYTNISLASSTGLLLLLQFESILVPLLKTGRSRTVSDLYDRYVATAQYIRKCYETDFYEPTSEGWRYITLVRGMHQNVHRMMRDCKIDKPKGEKLDSYVWVNQYDMAITQFAFIGLFLLEPTKCGAYHVKKDELADITYYWRILSYYFGIEERFNLFVYHDQLDKQLEYLRIILNHLKQLLSSEPRINVGVEMGKGTLLAFEDFSSESSFNILDNWWAPIVSLSGSKEPVPYSLSDRRKLILFNLYFKVLFRSEWLMSIFNTMYKKKFDKFCLAGDKIKRKLAKKYGNHLYEYSQYELERVC